ncbi:tetracycline repressor, C-all-alpha domain protein [Streptomyces cinereoruber]|uniref:TetR family transcriptional regulator n=1 Tax=Streptomyces cinereoruber TaxID=67260 RepID=A0AAV4KGZ4_9ACTN|nr:MULTISPECIES: TetR/AcrR family transcriptional regulator C-terminal domain-containing protein [Streptomyces]MBB4155986.1 AcrR family transcriptional regulator [Streptomyces cinereoruber]MBY8816895.1 TetR/AcrR family transcriptional regulator C-terminal domain-containing protein [Streptomyces cinereoruber]NIH64797.1 AcrR family transcriptional regulator [Streptomyces cinereoruber]PVC71834.1 TetR family transcriptional regulator [Streptomyces sp. CS081A]QEV32481.1 TetR family transcriptional 
MGRPRRPLLDRERIATTALEVVDEQGEFSVPQIAKRLGVQTASVYHHVDGRDGIVELLRERVASAIDGGTLDLEPWDAALVAWARSYRAAFAAHPRAIPLLTTSPVRAPGVLAQYEKAVGRLLDAGFALADVMPVIIALENLVLGSALDLAAPEAMWELADETATPRLARALDAVPEGRADQAFELALTGYLAHVRTLRDAP